MTKSIYEDLEKRVDQFLRNDLPGQPPFIHMGTSYLISDLWNEVRRLKAIELTYKGAPYTMTTKLVQVRAPHFVAAFETTDGTITDAAPILKYVIGWPDDRARAYILSKGWRAVLVQISSMEEEPKSNFVEF